MKITIEVEIFDDPEFCDGYHPYQCKYLEIYLSDNCGQDTAFCNLFFDGSDEVVDIIYNKGWIKCDQCKTAYKKAKSKTFNTELKENLDRLGG